MGFLSPFAQVPFFITLILFVAAAIIIYKFIVSKHKERMAMIEKGLVNSEMDSRKYSRVSTIRNAILFISIGIGLLLVSVIDFESFVADLSVLLIVGGVGFIVYYLMVLKRMDETED